MPPPTSPTATDIAAIRDGQNIGNLLPWLYPTVDFLNLDKFSSVALPSIGSTATILSFLVPAGRNGRIAAVGLDFVANGGAAFTQGLLPLQLTFSISTDVRGYGFPDFGSFGFSPGPVSAPTPIAGLMIKDGQRIVCTVTNNSITASTQFVAMRLLGYFYGKIFEPRGTSYQ